MRGLLREHSRLAQAGAAAAATCIYTIRSYEKNIRSGRGLALRIDHMFGNGRRRLPDRSTPLAFSGTELLFRAATTPTADGSRTAGEVPGSGRAARAREPPGRRPSQVRRPLVTCRAATMLQKTDCSPFGRDRSWRRTPSPGRPAHAGRPAGIRTST